MPVALYDHASAAINSTHALTCGGFDQSATPQSACFVYDSTQDLWSKANPMTTARAALQMIVYKGRIYALGGVNGHALDSVELWTSTSGWQLMPFSMYRGDFYFQSVSLP